MAETDVGRVTAGQSVQVTLDALPEQILTGRIARIAPLAYDYRGDQVFKATVDVSEIEGLRWGMTANVEIAARK